MPMRIGSLTISSNLFLSPLAGYTNLPFRLVVREIGGVGLCTTDLVNARSLLEKNKNAFKLIETRPADTPWPCNCSAPCPKKCAMRRPKSNRSDLRPWISTWVVPSARSATSAAARP